MAKRASQPVGGRWSPREPAPSEPLRLTDRVKVTGADGRLEQRLVKLVDEAADVVVLCSFLLASAPIAKAMRDAHGRGVRIYILTASEQLLARPATRLTDFDRSRVSDHKELLDELSSFALVRTAAHFHAKCLFTDPLSDPRGWLSTANLVTQSLRQSVDLGVELTADEVRVHFTALRWGFWEAAEHELAGPGLLSAAEPAGLAPAPSGESALFAVRGVDQIQAAQRAALAAVPERVIVTNFGWDLASPVVADLRELAQAGSEVVVLGRPDHRPAQSALEALADAGASVFGLDRMHAKVLISDQFAVVTTANFEAPTDGHCLELGIALAPEDARIGSVQAAVRHWVETAAWSMRP